VTNILSAISGQFGKSLILGTLLPAAIFVILGLIFVGPLFPIDLPLLESLEAPETQSRLLAVTFLTIVLSCLLTNLNIPIIRLYEGYPWKDSWIGQRCIRHYQAQFDAAQARWRGMRTLVYALRAQNLNDGRISEIEAEWGRIGRKVNTEFPPYEHLLLPTRMGNVIRAFESYSYRQYGIEAITLWPRLIAKIDKDYAASIDAAKTSFDFTLNSSALGTVLALAILIVGLIYPTAMSSPRLWVPWLLEVIGFAVLAYLFYLCSISRASAWGATVKGAFDLYRWALLRQLGYTRVPNTMTEERALWDDISLQMIYGDSPKVRMAEYTAMPTLARGEPYVVDLKIARGVSLPGADGTVTVTLCVKNVDAQERTAKNVLVTDTLPDGFDYEWDSASADSHSVPVVGTNPYHFNVGHLEPGKEVILTYRMILYKK
jgi:uncharacterized repeat protein (TIGR01451 family)